MEVNHQNNLAIAENNIFKIEIDYMTGGVTYANLTSKTFTGDIDFAIGYNSNEIHGIESISLDFPHTVYLPNTSETKTLYYVTGFSPRTTESLDYGNEYNQNQYAVQHNVFDGYDNETNESIWIPTESVVAYDSQTNDGINYTATWHTEHSNVEQWLDLGRFGVIECDYDGKDTWMVTQNRYIEAGKSYRLKIIGDVPVRLGKQIYKYDFAFKPSIETLVQAINSGHLYVVDPYWNTSWNQRFFVPYNKSMIVGTHNIFPPQYYFSGISGLNANGSDIRITYENGTQVPREIEFTNSITGNGSIFLLGNLSDTGFWFYYNNSAATEPAIDSTYGAEAVWDDNFFLVSHLNQEPNGAGAGTILDSTSNDHDGSQSGFTAASSVDGPYSKGISFPGGDEYINYGDTGYMDSGFTISAFVTKDNVVDKTIWSKMTGGAVTSRETFQSIGDFDTYYIDIYDTHGHWLSRNEVGVTAWPATPSTITGTWTGGTTDASLEVYVNGVAATTHNGGSGTFETANDVSATMTLGSDLYIWNRYYNGDIFEFRISNIFRGEDWIDTEYNNLNNPTSTGTAPFYDTIGEIQYYTDSLLYNATTNYNHTIESDGTITSNRSIVAADDTNDTAQSLGTSYLSINVFNNSAEIVRNFTFTGDNLDWYNVAGLTSDTTYHLRYSGNDTSISNSSTGSTTYLNLTSLNLGSGTYYIDSVSTADPDPTPTATPSPTPGYDGGDQNMNTNESIFPTILLGNSSSARILLGISDWVTELKQQITDLIREQGQDRPKSSFALWSLLSVFGLVMVMDGSTFLIDKNRTKTTFKLNAVVLIFFGAIISLSGLIWSGHLTFESLDLTRGSIFVFNPFMLLSGLIWTGYISLISSYATWGILSLMGVIMILDGSTYLLDKNRTKTTLQLNAVVLIFFGAVFLLSGLIWTGYLLLESSNFLWGLLSVFGLVMILDGSIYLLDKNRTKTTLQLNATLLIVLGLILSLSGLVLSGYIAIT